MSESPHRERLELLRDELASRIDQGLAADKVKASEALAYAEVIHTLALLDVEERKMIEAEGIPLNPIAVGAEFANQSKGERRRC